MNIKRITKVQQVDKYSLKTTIPADIKDKMDIKKGSTLCWTMEEENKVVITKIDDE